MRENKNTIMILDKILIGSVKKKVPLQEHMLRLSIEYKKYEFNDISFLLFHFAHNSFPRTTAAVVYKDNVHCPMTGA